MRDDAYSAVGWRCLRCGADLVPRKTKLAYLGKDFEAELSCCPDCGEVFVGEALALGKMLEVEKALEDK
ncbi:MAG: hypothetical protein LBD25_08420 [Coriobacteriales bacterium]|jgi:predicted RNA-binding Zn-ribbon protein involved in translation (DUF1610 family)|nr:hypothetical protein [Coriobacteriales bacterium]